MTDEQEQAATQGSEPPAATRRLGQAVTALVARRPWLWPLLRRPTRYFFDRAAPRWDQLIGPVPEHLAALDAALSHFESQPQKILDLGTGSGVAAVFLADRFPEAQVVGFDLSKAMVELARSKLDPALAERVRFKVADASKLPLADQSIDLVAQVSVPVFFAEMSRVLLPGGHALIVSSLGRATPFHTSRRLLERGFAQHGLESVADGKAGRGTYVVARRLSAPR